MAETQGKVLLVDDEILVIKRLQALLVPRGYQVAFASNGVEALEKVQQEQPDLIILDVMMPQLDGFETCRRLKNDAATRLIPIILMTALGEVEDRIKGIEAGADDFLTKPVNRDELLARIRTSLKLKQNMDDKLLEVTQVRDQFSKFVPDAVKRLVAENPQAPELAKQPVDVSVLFLDIVGYTRLCQKHDFTVIDSLVERYFSAFLDIIDEAGGDITETSGDGLMVIFRDADSRNHTLTAVDTALALFATTERMNLDNPVEPLGLHMGLNAGTALVGSTRFEGKRGTRWVFTADGPMINMASHLSSIAKSGELLLGPEPVKRIAERYPLQAYGSHRLKNIVEPVEVYCISAEPQ